MPDQNSAWQQLVIVRTALASQIPVDPSQLLLVRDEQGSQLRVIDPPADSVPREGAVLLLLYPVDDELVLPLTVRSERLSTHRGEVALPGGRVDPDDHDVAATALRECAEELGVDTQEITVLGTLAPLYIPVSRFRITPVVAYCAHVPEFTLNSVEVSAVFAITLRALLDPATVRVEQRDWWGRAAQVPYYAAGAHKIWGATAIVLSELVAKIRTIQQQELPNDD